jgi:ABC-type glycerol-3-phosphate transport system substrate-binding protein
MLDGIDYYPKRKKRIKRKLFFLLLLLVAASGGWLYLNKIDNGSTAQSTSIVISEPESEAQVIEIIVERVKEIQVEAELDNSENLDEVIQTYEASSHD